MFQYVHHVHYVVHNRDGMVDYLKWNAFIGKEA